MKNSFIATYACYVILLLSNNANADPAAAAAAFSRMATASANFGSVNNNAIAEHSMADYEQQAIQNYIDNVAGNYNFPLLTPAQQSHFTQGVAYLNSASTALSAAQNLYIAGTVLEIDAQAAVEAAVVASDYVVAATKADEAAAKYNEAAAKCEEVLSYLLDCVSHFSECPSFS